MSSRVTSSGGATQSRSSLSNSQRRHRSRSTSRYADLDKPKKKKTLSATTSLVSIPNTIKLSMLNSGLLSFEKVKLEARDENNSLSQTIPDKPIELRHFVKLCEQRRKFPVLYKLEFQTAVKVETSTCRHATRKNNLEKNQNQKCIPYDYNRVVLDKTPGVPDSDYINASYIDSLLKPNAYIVTQGPTEETVNDFWKMVWQENVSAIVMLTKTFDFTKVMCVQYWPPNMEVHETYGDIHINIVKEEQLANFQIRTFRLYKKNAEEVVTEERLILQFHYTEWHSHTCPFSNAVLEFRRRVRAVVGNIIKPNSMQGPMLVHCNDGGGRSGVYMAIDANLELAEEEDCFHVFGYLKKLRHARKGLIENVEQYKFVYDTLEEHVVCGKTWFPVSELSERLKAKAKKDPATKMNEYQREYAQICKQTPRFTIGDCAGGHRADNREKNRDVLCVPPDNFRPYLTSFQGNAFTDYINSVFVDGYTKPREYVVTEWPLKHTLGEFWSLVYDHECSAIVVLCQPPQNSQQYPPFWPQKSKSEKYGPVFSVDSVSGKHYQNIKQWEFKVNKKIISLTEMMAGVKAPTKTVQLFQLTCWPMGHKVPTSTNSLVFLMNMVETWRQRNDYGPVCVVSPDGRSRAGVYCAANACIEQVIQHGEVDVFQAVKTVRRHRPQLIDNMTEYKYCYDLVLHYVLHFLDKDLKAKKFIAFGRGKSIPLTPDSTNIDLPNEISNTGRIIVNKCIDKIEMEKRESMLQAEKDLLLSHRNHYSHFIDKHGKILERKKKGRLYSLGGNEPPRKGHRGRLDRLKTVGTFDLGTEMSVLSQVARNLNEQLISGELGILPIDTNRTVTSVLTTPSFHSSVHTSARNTPELRKRDIGRRTPLRSSLMHDSRAVGPEFRGQHSADDCFQTASSTPPSTSKKPRSLSTSSYIKERLPIESTAMELKPLQLDIIEPRKNETEKTTSFITEAETESKKIEEDVISAEHTSKRDFSKDFSYRSRKSMLRKSKRIVRTDSEIFKEGIIDRNEYLLRDSCDIQIHANQDRDNEESEARDVFRDEHCRNSSVASSSFQSRKDSSEIEDICSPKDRQKSTDESSKNFSTDDMDAVFSDSNTDLERLEKEYKELIKTNLQREYKSDGDTLDEVGKKRNEFGKWKNQSLEHEFEYSNQELMNIIDEHTLSSQSYCTSTDTKDLSRICSPESCANGAYSDSGVKGLDEKYSTYAKMRSRVYSSSRLGETPTERQRLYPMRNNVHGSFAIPIGASATVVSTTSDNINVDSRGVSRTAPLIRPSNLEINVPPRPKSSHDNPIHSLFEKPFGRFKRVNKLLKCKRFSTSTLYDKKKPPASGEVKKSPKLMERFTGKENQKESGLTATKSAINLSKLSLFSQKPGKSSSFWSRKSGMFSGTSHSNNELFSKSGSKTKLSEVSRSNTELSKYRTSPMKTSKKKGSKYEKNSGSACLPVTVCHSPLSEEFYNKTGSVRLSAVELYEKFCSEDFSGLYKNEHSKNDRRVDMHEYRLEQKGLRVIGRYNKNARLLKQRSEPKFNLRGTPGSSSYYHEEDEYYYHHGDPHGYGYYNEQDEYYNEYDDEDVEDIEGDYYEDDEEGDYYEDDVEGEDTTEQGMEDSPHFIDKDDENELEFQFQQCGATCLELSHRDSSKPLEQISTGTDSDVDEIYLMPSESKCIDEDEYGFENKQFSLEQSMLIRSTGKDRIDFLQSTGDQKPGSLLDSVSDLIGKQHDEVLTIYRICSKEEIMKISDNEADGIDATDSKKQRSTSLQSESLQKAVKEYIKYATSDLSIEPSIVRSDCTNIDRTDSLELLSNSSGTMRSRSTLTEYAFDTVRNMNLDSCSTSKLSLSLKSEVFDDFTITPDDLKTIQNCEIEDFTLTPDGSIGDSTNELTNNTKAQTADTEKSEGSSRACVMEDDCPSGVLVIVDKFLENERNNLHRQMSIEEPTTSRSQVDEAEAIPKGVVLETSFDEAFGSGEGSGDMMQEIEAELKYVFGKESANEPEGGCSEASRDDSEKLTEDISTKTSDSYHTPTTEQDSTTSNEYTVIDLYDDNDENAVSLFTSELTKEFDRLFSKAEQLDLDVDVDGDNPSATAEDLNKSTTHTDPAQNNRPKIPSRYSMQKLEPYFIADPEEEEKESSMSSKAKTSTPVANNVKPTAKTQASSANNNTSISTRNHHKTTSSTTTTAATAATTTTTTTTASSSTSSSRLKKTRSQSLGNLNKKTKCFPL